MVELREITSELVDEIVELEVANNQETFIETTNVKSLAEAYAMAVEGISVQPYGIYAAEKAIGFSMFIYDVLDNESFENEIFYKQNTYFIWHYMIDEQYQCKGFGRLAFEKLLEKIEEEPFGEAQSIALFYHKDNRVAKKLYASLGFIETEIVQGDSVFMIKMK